MRSPECTGKVIAMIDDDHGSGVLWLATPSCISAGGNGFRHRPETSCDLGGQPNAGRRGSDYFLGRFAPTQTQSKVRLELFVSRIRGWGHFGQSGRYASASLICWMPVPYRGATELRGTDAVVCVRGCWCESARGSRVASRRKYAELGGRIRLLESGANGGIVLGRSA